MAKVGGNKHKFKGRNNGPARQRYWQYGILRDHKVQSLMDHNGMTRIDARYFWDHARTHRVKT